MQWFGYMILIFVCIGVLYWIWDEITSYFRKRWNPGTYSIHTNITCGPCFSTDIEVTKSTGNSEISDFGHFIGKSSDVGILGSTFFTAKCQNCKTPAREICVLFIERRDPNSRCNQPEIKFEIIEGGKR